MNTKTITLADVLAMRGLLDGNGEAEPRRVLSAIAHQLRELDVDELTVPVVDDLDAKILRVVEAAPERFDMTSWHRLVGDDESDCVSIAVVEREAESRGCGTCHCRAGWAVALAGPAGRELEDKFSPSVAGGLIYLASTGRVPDFHTDDETALEDMRESAVSP